MSTAIQRALQLRASQWGGMINFSWSPEQPLAKHPSPLSQEGDAGAYFATAFSQQSGRLDIPHVSLDNLDEVEERLKEHIHGSRDAVTQERHNVYFYVCTHGQRDCRCGDTGGAVVQALRDEVKRRGTRQVKVAEVGHVSKHEFAANVLVYPHGEWLGRVNPSDVPAILDEILDAPAQPRGTHAPPLCVDHWRGRMGLDKKEQLAFAFSSG